MERTWMLTGAASGLGREFTPPDQGLQVRAAWEEVSHGIDFS